MADLAIPRVVKMPIETQATDALRESIVNGAILVGSRITEIQLSDQMGLSRATIRTALHQLAQEGLLTLVPYTGWRVVSMTSQDVWELYTLRSAVERLAAQLVAERIAPAATHQLKIALDHLVRRCRDEDQEKIALADFALHKTIIELTSHGRLISQYQLIEQQIRMTIRSSDSLVANGEEIVRQHRPIVEAIISGAAGLAGELSEQHNLSEGRKLTDHLERMEADAEAALVPEPVKARPGRPRKPKPLAAQ